MSTEEKIKALTQEFEVEVARLSNQIVNKADGTKDDSKILANKGMGFTITAEDGTKYNFEWKEVSFHLPIPHFTMAEQRVAFDVPSITMKTKDIIFDVPAVKMVDKQIGIKPETKCEWKIGWVLGVKTKRWECKVWDSPIIISVPETYSKRVEIKADIPEIKMERLDMVFHLPQVTVEMKRVRFNSIVLNNIDYKAAEGKIEDSEKDIRAQQKKLDFLTSSFQDELHVLTKQFTNEEFDKAEANLIALMKPKQEEYEKGITALKESIKVLKNNNATDQVLVEESKLRSLIEDMNNFMTPYEESLVNLNAARKSALDKQEAEAVTA